MSFFNSLFKVLGFGNDDADYNDTAIDATVTPIKQIAVETEEPAKNSSEPGERNAGTENEEIKTAGIPVERIFEKVVEIFNNSMPDFVARSLDKEKQQRYIYDALDQSLKQHLKDLADNADREAAIRWQNERKRLLSEIERHKENSKKQNETQEGLRSRQLSAERQKRALNERIHDLESKIATLEAEREQFDLENKSLINKLRAASVQDNGDGEQTRSVISQLENELHQTRDELEETRRRSQDDIEQLTTKLQLAEAIARESQSLASTAKTDITGRDAEIENLKKEISALKSDARISDDKATVDRSTITELEEKNRELTQQLEAMSADLEAANENLKTLGIIETQLEKFEEIKNRKDAKIKELSNSRESLIERIRLLENERRGLKRTVETNIAAQSESEIKMRDEITRLRQELADMRMSGHTAPEDVLPYQAVRPEEDTVTYSPEPTRISAIDESLDNTDWLVATPPEGTSMRNLAKNDENSDFGYQAPAPRKFIPDNDAQMSLWDD